MGIYDRDYYRKEGPSFLEAIIPQGRVCKALIGINIVVFLLEIFLRRSGVPLLSWLELDPDKVMHGEVWRLLSYAFVHEPNSLWHILFNMLFLWWFGSDIEIVYGPREFAGFYLVAALLGGVCFQAWALATGTHSTCIGASGAVTATLVLCACHFPQRTILVMFVVPMPIWLFAIGHVVIDLYRAFNHFQGQISEVAWQVHLAGAGFGFAYYKLQFRVTGWWSSLTDGLSFRNRRRIRPSVRLYRPEEENEPVAVGAIPSASGLDEHLEAKLDAVLEKVSQQGQGSLTENERKILLRASEIYKKRRT